MNKQFSYELDERKIKFLLNDAELTYNESLWNKFDSLELANEQKHKAFNIYKFTPNFNLSVSRSVLVPIVFIFIIGSLSAMLFSFVDFKKKEIIDKEIPLVANPVNYKKAIVNSPIVKKPIKINTNNTAIVSTPTVISTSTTAIVANSIKIKQTQSVKSTNASIIDKNKVAPTSKKETTALAVKKKKKVVNAEELPTIKTITNLNEGANEPELELNLDLK